MSRYLTPIPLLILALFAADMAAAQGILDRARRAAERGAERAVEREAARRADRAVTAAIGATEDAIVCAATDRRCIEEARADGDELVIVDASGNPVAHENAPGAATGAAEAGAAQAAAPVVPGRGAWATYSFVPGDRILFEEDFSGDAEGLFPAKRLIFQDGAMQIVEWEGRRMLGAMGTGDFRIPLPETLPERFTMEFDVILDGGLSSFSAFTKEFSRRLNFLDESYVAYRIRGDVGVDGPVSSTASTLRDGRHRRDGELVHLRVAVDGTYATMYLNETRVANLPAASFSRTDFVNIRLRSGSEPAYLDRVRIAAGGDRLADRLLADGRVSTQGILFDTASARIRPESTPTLKGIADALRQHGDLRIRIEGHTDSVGAAAANQRLSEQRAQAVVAHLTEHEGIAANRIEAVGMGEEQPVADNATAEGRAQNRRVELVRLD